MLEISEDLKAKILTWRRDLHKIPEPGFCEIETAKKVSEILESVGFSVENGVARTGVIGEFGSGRTVMIRCEMDGYPVTEELNHPYSSSNSGLMHACGHDANMACVLGAAQLLSGMTFNGKVRILMQPSAESISPEDQMSGSNKSIEEGVLKDVEALFSFHVDSTIKSGSIGILKNKIDNRIEDFTISIKRLAESDWNAMYAGSKIVRALYDGALEKETYKSLLEISTLEAQASEDSTAYAVITGSFESKGRDTFRFFDNLLQTCCNAEKTNECTIEYRYDSPDRNVYFSDTAYKVANQAASSVVGEDSVSHVARKAWSDDFFPFSSRVSSALVFLGTGTIGSPQILHTSTFDIDESNLHIGSLVLANAVNEYFESTGD